MGTVLPGRPHQEGGSQLSGNPKAAAAGPTRARRDRWPQPRWEPTPRRLVPCSAPALRVLWVVFRDSLTFFGQEMRRRDGSWRLSPTRTTGSTLLSMARKRSWPLDPPRGEVRSAGCLAVTKACDHNPPTPGPAGPTASLGSLFRVSPDRDLQFQTLELTFSSAETSAILGRGAGARFLISSMTSGGTAWRAGYHLTPSMRHGARQGDPRAEKQGSLWAPPPRGSAEARSSLGPRVCPCSPTGSSPARCWLRAPEGTTRLF